MLDTCGLLSLSGIVGKKLTKCTLDDIQSAHTVYLSSCSHFEISLKHKQGQLPFDEFDSPEAFWDTCLQSYDLTEVSVSAADFASAVNLPDHHRDPFDRIIIAQAIRLGCGIVSYDRQFQKYDVRVSE